MVKLTELRDRELFMLADDKRLLDFDEYVWMLGNAGFPTPIDGHGKPTVLFACAVLWRDNKGVWQPQGPQWARAESFYKPAEVNVRRVTVAVDVKVEGKDA